MAINPNDANKTVRGTHSELTDPTLRLILANELLVLRFQQRQMRNKIAQLSADDLWLIRIGLDTALRRVQDVREYGMEEVYKQNYMP